MKLKIFEITFFLFGFLGIAQETISSSGGTIKLIDGSLSYTVGQVFYNYQSSSNAFYIEGVQQPFEISETLGIEKSIEIKVYPNPTLNGITLNIENYEITNLSYLIFDLNGRFILKSKIISNETYIAFENFAATTYLLKIMNLNQELITFKIIKKY